MTKEDRKEERHILEAWMIIEAIAHRQNLKKYHTSGPTPDMIYNDIKERYGPHFHYGRVKDLLFSLDGDCLFYDYTGGGGYPLYFHFRIHPDFYPEEPIEDPYTEKERTALREYLKDREERRLKAEEKALQRRREREAEKRDEERRRKARRKARPTEIVEPKGWRYIDVEEAKKIILERPSKALILDTETTGLSSYSDDILELSIIDGGGRKLFSERFNSWAKEWEEAEAIHHIRPEDVKDLPHIEERREIVSSFFEGAELLIGYNLPFDLSFIVESGVHIPDGLLFCDVMEDFSTFYGEWADWINEGWGGWKWQKLTTASRYYHISTEGAHGSLKDCEMTREVLLKLADEPVEKRKRPRPDGREDLE